jgi:Kef-type K+ transport system membrane component KefB
MPDVGFTNLLGVLTIAFVVPLTLGFAPRLRIPAVVVEIVAGIVVGPHGLGWLRADQSRWQSDGGPVFRSPRQAG